MFLITVISLIIGLISLFVGLLSFVVTIYLCFVAKDLRQTTTKVMSLSAKNIKLSSYMKAKIFDLMLKRSRNENTETDG